MYVEQIWMFQYSPVSQQCNVLSWHSCGCHLTYTICLNTVVDQAYPLMAAGLICLTSRTLCPQKLLRNGSRDLTKSPRRPNPPDPNLIEHLWNMWEQVWSMEAPSPQHTGPKETTTNVPVPNTTGCQQRSNNHVFTGQSCFGCTRETHRTLRRWLWCWGWSVYVYKAHQGFKHSTFYL